MDHDSVGVVAIYCNFKEQDLQTPENLLASCCVQLCQHRLPNVLITLHRIHNPRKTRPMWNEIIRIFEDCLTSHDTVYIIVDALDECSNDVRSVLLTYFKTPPSNVRLLVTTRHVSEIVQNFHASSAIEIRASSSDLRKYISSKITDNSRLAEYIKDQPSLEQIICDEIASKADGM